jgi:hypothetical protein
LYYNNELQVVRRRPDQGESRGQDQRLLLLPETKLQQEEAVGKQCLRRVIWYLNQDEPAPNRKETRGYFYNSRRKITSLNLDANKRNGKWSMGKTDYPGAIRCRQRGSQREQHL